MSRPRWIVTLAAIVALPALAWFVDQVRGTPPVVIAAAAVPALIWASVLALLDRRQPGRLAVVVAALLAGTVVAAAAGAQLNELARAHLGLLAGEAAARALTGAVAAPIAEETAKAGALVVVMMLWHDRLADARAGLIHGALVGVGFAFTENLGALTLAALQGGMAGVLRAAWIRAVLGGLHHAVFTATTGAGLGWMREGGSGRKRAGVALAAFGAALAQHVAWNTVAAERLARALCNAAEPGGRCASAPDPVTLLVTAPVTVAVFLGPGVVALIAVGVAASRRRRHDAAVRASSRVPPVPERRS